MALQRQQEKYIVGQAGPAERRKLVKKNTIWLKIKSLCHPDCIHLLMRETNHGQNSQIIVSDSPDLLIQIIYIDHLHVHAEQSIHRFW